jgi:hypothetical protein
MEVGTATKIIVVNNYTDAALLPENLEFVFTFS